MDSDALTISAGAFLDLGGDPATSQWANVHAADGTLCGRIFFDPNGLGCYTVTRTERVSDGDTLPAYFHRKPPSRTIHPDADD
jgi:hypothetical protein